MKGKVKWFNAHKGFGFLVGDDGKDVFIHYTSIPEGTDLYEEDRVEYQVENSDKGLRALDLKKLDSI